MHDNKRYKRRTGYIMLPVFVDYAWTDGEKIDVYNVGTPSTELVKEAYATLPIVYKSIPEALEDRFALEE